LLESKEGSQTVGREGFALLIGLRMQDRRAFMRLRIVTLVAVVTAVALPLMAQGRAGRPGPGGPGFMPMLSQLNLTDTQKAQIKALADADRQSGPPKSLELEQKLHAAILAETPDLQAIEALKASITAAHAEELDRRIDHLQKLAQILTPEQKQQWLALQLEAHLARRNR
jgi:Spy/CpxP family protein refolding chaperone